MWDLNLAPLTRALLLILGTVIIGFWIKVRKQWASLSKIPGPPTLPIIGSFLEFLKDREVKIVPSLLRLAENYDGIFKLNLQAPLVLISKPEYLQTFYTHAGNIDRSDQYEHLTEPIGYSVFNADGAQWRKLRKIMMTNFFGTPLEAMRPIFLDVANELVADLRKLSNGPFFPCHKLIVKATASSISLQMNAKKLLVDMSDEIFKRLDECSAINEDIPKDLENFLMDYLPFCMWVIYVRNFSMLYYFKYILKLTPVGRRYYRHIDDADVIVKSIVQKKERELKQLRENGESIPNLYIYNMLENHSNESLQTLTNELKILIVTGVDTTAATLSFMLTCMGLHVECQEKLYEEDVAIRQQLGGREPTLEDLQRYELLERIIKETLRIFPVGPFIARKLGEDTYFGKYLIPKGTNVAALQISTNHNPALFPNPMTFDPDRFLPENAKNIPPYAFNPFSAGPRGCPGNKYATVLMKIFLIAIIREFRILSAYKSFEDALANTDAEITLKDKKGSPIRLIPRS